LDRGKSIYHFWMISQIITAILSYFIITPLGWIGLVLITFLSAVLTTFSSIWVAKKADIIIAKTIDFKNLISIVFSTILFIGISFILNYFLKSTGSIFAIIFIKLIVGFFAGFLLLFFRHKELYKKLLVSIQPFFINLKGTQFK